MTLKQRFMNAVIAGELGKMTDSGAVVTVPEFKAYFSDINEGYAETFLPAAVIETGQYSATHTRYLFRVRNGVYRVHPEALLRDIKEGMVNQYQVTPASAY